MHDKLQLWIGPVCLLIGAVFGSVTGGQLGGDEGQAHRAEFTALSPIDGDAGSNGLVDAVSELNETVSTLKDVLFSLQAAQGRNRPTRIPVSDSGGVTVEGRDDESAEDLAGSMSELTLAIKALLARPVVGTGSLRELELPGPIDSRGSIDFSMLRDAEINDDREQRNNAEQAFQDEHRLLSQQQILSQYGMPRDTNATEAGFIWMYEMHLPGEGEFSFHFKFHEGLVYQTRCDFDLE
ncbi:MAG: hypothetical protein KUG67_02870 [Proteobacteria bacterium]|nr:hypothetical protein [Pseudomonadota bacterium]